MANNNQNQNTNDTGLHHHLTPAAANRPAINQGQAGSQFQLQTSPLHHHALTPGLVGQAQTGQHQSSSGIGLQPDSIDLNKIAAMLQSQHQRIDGLDKLQTALAKTPARKLLCDPPSSIPGGNYQLQNMFKGLRACLQVAENQSDALLRVNQILYEMMQDLPRSPNELMPEVTNLIPYFIENLGNSKATVRKSTHKCIGTYVKFSKRLEFVVQNIIKYGLENQNQRTRQHSMLVIPALISLKSSVIQGVNFEMKQLIEAVITRLRDPADSVAKTAKKLLLELQKCYPTVFKQNYIESLPNEEERAICSLILENKFDDATKLIMSTSPSKRMALQQNTVASPPPQAAVFNPPAAEMSQPGTSAAISSTRNDSFADRQTTQPIQSPNFGAIGKAIVPTSNQSLENTKSDIRRQNSFTNNPSAQVQQQQQQQQDTSSVSGSFMASERQAQRLVTMPSDQSSYASGQTPAPSQSQFKPNQQQPAAIGSGVKLGGDLSVVGREIMSSQVKPKSQVPATQQQTLSSSYEEIKSQEGQTTKKKMRSQTTGGLPIDSMNGLVFGFLEEDLVDALNENNQWKDRTNAMEEIEAQLMQLIGNVSAKQRFNEQVATAFLGFIYQFITDINFKISLASIKMVTLLLQEDMINLKMYFQSLLGNLVEKLSDSKQVVRDIVMECCCNLITRSKPVVFASQIIKYLQHANWHVREGVLNLLVRSILITSVYEARKGSSLKPNIPGSDASSLQQICTNVQLIEEICFLVKVEDKKLLQQMGVDTLALMIAKSPARAKTENIIMKELGVQADQKQLGQTKDNQIYGQISQRMQAQAYPFINSQDQVEFVAASASMTPQQSSSLNSAPPSTQFLQHKQQEMALSEGNNAPQPSSEIQQISQSLQQMQINNNFSGKAGGPSSKMQTNQAAALLNPDQNSYKTPSMAFLENKRREEEKQLHSQQQYPQSADFKKVQGGPMSPIGASGVPTHNSTTGGDVPVVSAAALQQQNQQSAYSMRKLAKKGAPANGSGEDDTKIAMWLPSFSPLPDAASSHQPSAGTGVRNQEMMPSPVKVSGKDPRLQSMQLSQEFNNQSNPVQIRPQAIPRSSKAPDYNGYHLNATASSSATFIEESRVNINQGSNLKPPNSRQPMHSEANKTQSDNMQQQNYQGNNNSKANSNDQKAGGGYIPEVGKPRSIQSNYDKQRTFNQSQGSNNSSNQSSTGPSQNTISGTTQPTSNSNGFDKSQISDRLQLLKNTNKYKTKVGEGLPPGAPPDAMMGGHPGMHMQVDQYSDSGRHGGGSASVTQTMNYTVMPETDQQSTSHPHSMYNKRQGPIRAAHLTINQDQKSQQNVGNKKMSAGLPTHVQLKQQRASQQLQTVSSQSSQKPPTISQYSNFTGINEPRGASATQYDETSRASSIDYTQGKQPGGSLHSKHTGSGERPIRPLQNRQNLTVNSNASQSEKKPGAGKLEQTPQSLANLLKQDSTQAYEAKEEPLQNPEGQLRPAIEALKSSDWSKTFEACNVIKRGVLFHKNLFTHPSSLTTQTFKDIVKACDSLRSQVAKNACLTLRVMVSELAPRDVDSHIEIVLPTILKRSTDTNQFIHEEAEKTLIAICNNCTETRVFAALQAQPLKSAPIKEKLCMCYTVLIERLAHRLKNFRDLERLVQTVVRFLSEGAVEVRNQAKYAVLTLQSVCGTQRELDGILLKARLNENQMEKVKKVLASEDFESLSNYANTRYGASMRASPLGGARHTQYNAVGQAQTRHQAAGSYGASGSDGFQRNPLNNMQQTFLSSGAVQKNHSGARGGSSGPVGTSGIGNPIPTGGGVMSDHHVTMQRGATSNHGSSSGFDATQNTFNKRTTSVSKPIDRNIIEELRNLVDSCNTNDWQKRLKAIDQLQTFASAKSTTIRNSHASFINLIDAYCKLLQDNNTKVQTKCQQSFEAILSIQEMGPLVNSNLIMIVTALTQNMCSTNSNVRQQGDRLLDFLEEVVVTESRGNTNALLQPIVGSLAQHQNKVAKPQLVDRLSNLVERVDKQAIINRLLSPLVQPGHKLQQEANGNVALKQALQRLAITIHSAEVGIHGMGIGLKMQY